MLSVGSCGHHTLPQAEPADNWTYKAEGAINVVFTYTGPNPLFQHRVLRVPKSRAERASSRSRSKTFRARMANTNLAGTLGLSSDPDTYAKETIAPFLGSRFFGHTVRLRVPSWYLEAAARRLNSPKLARLRPPHRLANGIDITAACVTLMDDYTLGWFDTDGADGPPASPVLAVEVKPKCGFRPTSSALRFEVKRRVCRYHMHQHVKYASGSIRRVSNYCPVRLLQGDADMCLWAVCTLCEDPQNNLRVFRDGAVVYDGAVLQSVGCQGSGVPYLRGVLQSTMCEGVEGDDVHTADFVFAQVVAFAIHREAGLRRRLLATQALDCDVEHLMPIVEAALSRGKWTTEVRIRMVSRWRRTAGQLARLTCPLLLQESHLARNFLIATTTKDLSLMLTFQLYQRTRRDVPETTGTPRFHDVPLAELPEGVREAMLHHWSQSRGRVAPEQHLYLRYAVSVLDADPKDLARLPKYLKLDAEVAGSYEKAELLAGGEPALADEEVCGCSSCVLHPCRCDMKD